MGLIPKLIILFEGLGFIIGLILIIYLILRRMKIREKENFEKRDN